MTSPGTSTFEKVGTCLACSKPLMARVEWAVVMPHSALTKVTPAELRAVGLELSHNCLTQTPRGQD